MFSSVSAEHFEGEVEYDCRLHGEECYGCVYEQRIDTPYQQHNPTNPILVFARQHPDANILWSYLPFRPTDAMIAHARKVLRRRRDWRIAAEVEALFPKEPA